ncbi:spindle pole body-associated protein sad1 [Colletotrichum truncatum]|uniref:Spindle pole body-associated protein sad1 n=1 Tax=Colletotrichum truncatum TaxID=5467 RepID=A0ACC3YEV0_COLTU|nr:spindle pole body-associated protein sad1 [Colletotrichum truncatum]KAF6784908.1 spindle pole body-associated protein sad1 [Colletotrichum truncatum]
MPPKRKPRRDEDELQSIRGTAAITKDLPSLPSRFDTSYGSAPSTIPRNNRRGQVRNIQDAVQDALNDDDSEDDQDDRDSRIKSNLGIKPKPHRRFQPELEPEPEPEPEPDVQPDFGPEFDSDSESPPPRDSTPELPRAHNSPQRSSPLRTAPTVESVSFQADLSVGTRRSKRLLPGAAPPKGSDLPPPGPTTGRASRDSSEGAASMLAPKSTWRNSGAPTSDSHFPPASQGSVFHRALAEGTDRFATRRLGSEDPAPTPDSVRTFGQESSLFGDATIASLSSKSLSSVDDNPVPTIEEDSPVEAEEDNVFALKSPSKRLLRPPKHNPPMAPRSFNRPDQPKEPIRSPVVEVADRPAPDVRPPHNSSLPSTPPEPPRTPTGDRLRPQKQSPQAASPAQPAVVQVVPVTTDASLPARSQRGSSLPAVSSTSRLQSTRAMSTMPDIRTHAEEPSNVNRNLFHQSPARSSPSPFRPGPARQPVFASPRAAHSRPTVQPPFRETSPPRTRAEPRITEFRSNTHKQDRYATGQKQGGLFTRDMREKVELERQQDEAEQQALRSVRKARLQAWPRVYKNLYTWTNTARPDTPESDVSLNGSEPRPRRLPRQVPMKQFPWGSWILFTLADTFADILSFIFSPEAWLIRAVFGLALASFIGWTIFSGLSSVPALGLGGLQWYGFSDIAHNLGQFMPLWMTRPSTMFSDEDTREYLRRQRDHEYEITKLMTSAKLHEGSLSRLQQIIPKVVHMDLDKHGQPVVSQDFYHALRDLMKSDAEVLTLDRGHGGYHFISDEHWRAIKDRLKKDSVYQNAATPPKPGLSTTDVEGIVKNSFSNSWEKWLKSNNMQVAKILEPAFGTSIPDKIEKDLEAKLEKYVKDLYKEKGTKDVVVTREEFIRHLKGEFAAHRNEVKAEAQELQKKLEEYISQSVDLAMSKAPPSGVSRTEMVHIVDEMIRQAIANAGLEALAKGKIGANWISELRRQVNYLTIGNGVVIDPDHTSPDYQPSIKGKIGSPAWLASTKRSPYVLGAVKTLLRWEDEGECWCGQTTVDKQGQSLGVFISYLLSHEIIPRHVVVEHILPSATLNPEARPKDMEVWAYIAEVTLRSRVEDFSASHFPAASRQKWLSDGWVKIGQFTYESNDALDGVHVHQLSPELVNLGAATDHIILRAVSNHGADHTCIYRARLFGDRQA